MRRERHVQSRLGRGCGFDHLQCVPEADPHLPRLDRVGVPILDALDRFAGQPRRVPIGYVGVLGIKQVKHVDAKPYPHHFPVAAEIDQGGGLRALRLILEQRCTGEVANAGGRGQLRSEPSERAPRLGCRDIPMPVRCGWVSCPPQVIDRTTTTNPIITTDAMHHASARERQGL